MILAESFIKSNKVLYLVYIKIKKRVRYLMYLNLVMELDEALTYDTSDGFRNSPIKES